MLALSVCVGLFVVLACIYVHSTRVASLCVLAGQSIVENVASLIGGLARLTQRTAELREREQSERLERLNCAVCLVEQRAVAYVPCGHVACCRTCAPKMDTCPLCKAVVRTRVPVYLP